MKLCNAKIKITYNDFYVDIAHILNLEVSRFIYLVLRNKLILIYQKLLI